MFGAITQVANPRLKDTLFRIYQIGDRMRGGTAGAVRFTKETGRLVGGSDHLIKARERIVNLQRILREEHLTQSDRALAEYVLKELRQSLR